MNVKTIPGYRKGSTYFTCESESGFFYRTKIKKNNVNYLVCVEKNCSAKATCNETVFLKLGEYHNHLPDMNKEESLLLKDKMLNKAITTSQDLKLIFVEGNASARVEAAGKLAFPAVAQSMRRQRRKTQPDMPTSLEQFGTKCKENLRYGFVDEKQFCRGVVGEGPYVSVLFLSDELKQLLSETKEIHIDGTFKTRPRQPESCQLLTILAVQYGIAFPCAFALMKNRSVQSYDAVFSKIKELVPQFAPRLIMTDFEMALCKSLERNFPNAVRSGSFFHYCQAVMRQTGVLGMIPLLRSNQLARKALKKLLCLPLLPAANFRDGIQIVHLFLRENNLEEPFMRLMSYHERQWVRRVGPNAVSVFQRPRRTNNDAESFHAYLQRILRIRGPNVWEFVDGLRNICAGTVRELQAFIEEGLQIRSLKKRKYRLNDKRIKEATAEFNRNGNVCAFLNMVSHTLDTYVQQYLPDDIDQVEEEEQLLAPLQGDVPAEFNVISTNAEEDDDEEDVAQHSENEEADGVRVISEERNFPLCIICQEQPPTTVIIPCNHFGLCDVCRERMEQLNATHQRPHEDDGYTVNYNVCPLDRLPMERFIRVIPT